MNTRPANIPARMRDAFLVITLLVLSSCAATPSDSPGVDDDTLASNATSKALTNSLTDSLGSIPGTTALVKALRVEDTDNVDAEQDDDSDDRYGSSDNSQESFSCNFDSTDHSTTCDCPLGGTMTYIYDDEVNIQENTISFDHTMTTVFEQCTFPACGEDAVINGTIYGSMRGEYEEDNPESASLTANHYTEDECSGLNVNGLDVGFNMTIEFAGSSNTVKGTFCTNPPGEVVEFNSFEELMSLFDPFGSCQMAEQRSGSSQSGSSSSSVSSHSTGSK